MIMTALGAKLTKGHYKKKEATVLQNYYFNLL